jgi:protein-S-isoprenylcysteine O-methyltransferase Ste14
LGNNETLEKIKQKARRAVEIVFTVLLFGTQTILLAGIYISIMTIPLLPYLTAIPSLLYDNPQALSSEIAVMLFWKPLIAGRIVALVGVIIFSVATIQWLWYHHKKVGLFTKGLYSKIRHPQFLGISITSLGLTIMVLTFGDFPFTVQQLVALWFLQVLGYTAIAFFEERSLSKKLSGEYERYALKVPFIFPVRSPRKIPELLFTLLIFALICTILLALPYDLIRSYSTKLIPTSPLTY